MGQPRRTTAEMLRRLARPAPAAAPPTPSRALRLALVRAADRAAGLALSVLSVAEDVAPLDDALPRLEGGLMLLSLVGDGAPGGAPAGAPPNAPVGLVALDAEARAAVVEAQALGRPSPQPAEPREPTAADVALCEPMLRAFLQDAAAATAGTALDGWIGGAALGPRWGSAREAGMALPDGAYRAMRLTLDLGAGGRQGLLVVLKRVAPLPRAGARDGARDGAAPRPPAFSAKLSGQVMRASAPVEAVLARVRLTIDAAEGLAAGQVLPLPGVTVASVRLRGPGGADLGPARLGQVAGTRAVRLEAPLAPELGEVRPPLRSLAG